MALEGPKRRKGRRKLCWKAWVVFKICAWLANYFLLSGPSNRRGTCSRPAHRLLHKTKSDHSGCSYASQNRDKGQNDTGTVYWCVGFCLQIWKCGQFPLLCYYLGENKYLYWSSLASPYLVMLSFGKNVSLVEFFLIFSHVNSIHSSLTMKAFRKYF